MNRCLYLIHQACKSPKYWCSSMEGGRRIGWMLEKWKVVVCTHREQPFSRLLCTRLATISTLHLCRVTVNIPQCFDMDPLFFVLQFAKPLWHGKGALVLVNCSLTKHITRTSYKHTKPYNVTTPPKLFNIVHKVWECYLVAFLNQTLQFEWFLVQWGSDTNATKTHV
jgi:hypothetical protein